MRQQRRQKLEQENEKWRRDYAENPASKHGSINIKGKRCPRNCCTGNMPSQRSYGYLWRDHIIHYAFVWKFSNVDIAEWMRAPPTLLHHMQSCRLKTLTANEKRMSLMRQFDDQSSPFFNKGTTLPREYLRGELTN